MSNFCSGHCDHINYMPVGITPDNGKIKVRDEAGVKNLRNELESTVRKSEKAGGAIRQ
ncbi:MAG: hypothetical protein NTZ22_13665 [Hyphomicrobiales bacterium]|nr:hypothetical protein [Hyphomicrobiales bacterium]